MFARLSQLTNCSRVGQAKTGTGKTLAFLLPIIQRMINANPELAQPRSRGFSNRASVDDIRAVIISPTRELAEQIAVEAKKISSNTGIVVQTAVGGTQKNYHLQKMQREGCHILVGTPGRMKDILSDSYTGVSLSQIDAFVLDEADRLLDIGFAPDIDEIKSYMPRLEQRDRQTMMFSATIAPSVVGLVRKTMKPDFKFVRTVSNDDVPTHERVPQKVVFLKGLENQMPALLELAQRCIEAHKTDPTKNEPFKAIVYFGSTSEVTLAAETFEKLSSDSNKGGRWGPHPLAPAILVEMHSRLNQSQRTRNSEAFRRAESAILFSSDVTARGMDFPNVSHVIQIGLPHATEDYIHRIGRTGRAGKSGEGWLFVPEWDRREFQREIGHDLPIDEDNSLSIPTVDMTRDAQLPASSAKILSSVQSAVRGVPMSAKVQAYMGQLGRAGKGRQKEHYIQALSNLTRYGWGLSDPPVVNRSLAAKLGIDRLPGLRVDDGFGRGAPMGGRGREMRPSEGIETDPFGRPIDSTGSSRAYYDDKSASGGSRYGDSGSRGSGYGGSRSGDRSRSGGGGYGGSSGRGGGYRR